MKQFSPNALEFAYLILNYRLSGARCILENVFGNATLKFRVFSRSLCAKVETAIDITKAVIILHNFLIADRKFSNNSYFDEILLNRNGLPDISAFINIRQVESNSAFINIRQVESNNYTRDAKQAREDFVKYFNSPEGSVS